MPASPPRTIFSIGELRLSCEAFDFSAFRAEIDEQAHLEPGAFEIVDDLRPVLRRDCADGFQFNDDLTEADEVRNKPLLQTLTPIGQPKGMLRGKLNAVAIELSGQAFLVDRFQEAAAHNGMHIE